MTWLQVTFFWVSHKDPLKSAKELQPLTNDGVIQIPFSIFVNLCHSMPHVVLVNIILEWSLLFLVACHLPLGNTIHTVILHTNHVTTGSNIISDITDSILCVSMALENVENTTHNMWTEKCRDLDKTTLLIPKMPALVYTIFLACFCNQPATKVSPTALDQLKYKSGLLQTKPSHILFSPSLKTMPACLRPAWEAP